MYTIHYLFPITALKYACMYVLAVTSELAQLKKTPWAAEEDEQLITAQAKIGNSWTRISLEIPGRRCLDSSESISCLYSSLF